MRSVHTYIKQTCQALTRLLLVIVCFSLGTLAWAQEAMGEKAIAQKASSIWSKLPVMGGELKLPKPQGFIQTVQESLIPSSKGTQIQASASPGAFQLMARGYTAAKLSALGMKLIQKNVVLVNGNSGILVETDIIHFGKRYGKWILVFGDESKTIQITTIFPQDEHHTSQWMANLRQSLLKTEFKG
jgi:hypothetical protein